MPDGRTAQEVLDALARLPQVAEHSRLLLLGRFAPWLVPTGTPVTHDLEQLSPPVAAVEKRLATFIRDTTDTRLDDRRSVLHRRQVAVASAALEKRHAERQVVARPHITAHANPRHEVGAQK